MFYEQHRLDIQSLSVGYTGEQWRLGTATRTDQINFEYSTNATDLVTGTYTGVPALNFVSSDTATIGAKNVNAAANRTARFSPITSLSIANGAITAFCDCCPNQSTGTKQKA